MTTATNRKRSPQDMIHNISPDSQRGRVLQSFINSGTDKMLTSEIVRMTDLSNDQVNSATASLASRGIIKRVKMGVYRLADKDTRLAVTSAEELSQTLYSSVPIERDRRPSSVITIEDIDSMLETLFPNGIKIRHLGAINKWRSLTLSLVQNISNNISFEPQSQSK